MKINVGCGKQTWPDFFCIDAGEHPKATRPLDLQFAYEFDGRTIREPIPLDDGAADEVHAYHFIEHFYRWEAPAIMLDFHRLLKPGGKLILELPDIQKCARNLLKSNNEQYSMWGFYGDPGWEDPFMCHKWGYDAKTIVSLVSAGGFSRVMVMDPKTHGRRDRRDMRVEAIKK